MEIFVAYTSRDFVGDLGRTLDAWERVGEPVAIQCNTKKFELHRRITAENMSRDNYVLAELGTEPLEIDFAEIAEGMFSKLPTVGMLGAWRIGQIADELPNGVVVCRKNVIEKWPVPVSSYYIQEHVKAYELAGMKTLVCRQLHYRRMSSSLPC